jgi:hypothetical protein
MSDTNKEETWHLAQTKMFCFVLCAFFSRSLSIVRLSLPPEKDILEFQ